MSSMSSPALPAAVEPPEQITRFLRYSRYFNLNTGRIKLEGLLPPPVDIAAKRTRLETSVYRADDVSSEDLWEICATYVDRPDSTMKARATVEAAAFLERQLAFDADGNPHPRHANVIDWPEEKHLQKDLAREIADRMTELKTLEGRP